MSKYGEPWYSMGVAIGDGEGNPMFSGMSNHVGNHVPLAERQARAARSAACVNFCRGYSIPEDITLAEVVGALRDVLPHVTLPTEGPDMEACDKAYRQARAILSRLAKEDG